MAMQPKKCLLHDLLGYGFIDTGQLQITAERQVLAVIMPQNNVINGGTIGQSAGFLAFDRRPPPALGSRHHHCSDQLTDERPGFPVLGKTIFLSGMR
jgi:hypothetical protein